VLEALSGLSRDGLAGVAAPLLSLEPDPSNTWPPAAGIILKATRTEIVGYSVCASHSSSSSFNSSSSSFAGSVQAAAGAGPGGSSSLEWPGPLPQQQIVAALAAAGQDAQVRGWRQQDLTSSSLYYACSMLCSMMDGRLSRSQREAHRG
jgi:hypothetical protein